MATGPSLNSEQVRFGPFEFDPHTYELKKSGRHVRLRPQAARVLSVLTRRAGQAVTRDELKTEIWGSDTFVDFENGLNLCIRQIRAALDDDAETPRYVETLSRRGYRFIAPAHKETPESSVAVSAAANEKASRGAGFHRRQIALFAASLAAITAIVLLWNPSSWWGRLMGPSSANIHSLAVLPLANLSHDPEQEYFADGMTEELIANLAQVRALRVISRTSSMHYKGTNQTLPQIARELGVDAVIEGTVQRSGNRIQVATQLIRGETGTTLWAKKYERNVEDVLLMQSELAQAIVGEIKVQLRPEERELFASVRPINSEAYDAYLLGNYHSSKRTPAAIAKAIEYFQKAIRLDPVYAQAYAGLAGAYFERDIWGGGEFGGSADQIRYNTLNALELNGSLAEAHALLGEIYFGYDWDWPHAEAEFKRAIELNANSARSYEQYAFFLQAMGRQQEALAAVHRAVELDPLSAWYICEEGRVLYRARRYDDAIARYERALELDPAYLPALSRIRDAYEQLGKYDEALAWSAKYQQASGNPGLNLALRARVYAHLGKRDAAVAVLNKLGNGNLSNEYRAGIYSALGEHDRAIAELEKIVKARSAMPFIFVDPQLDGLRSDPRFKELMRRIGLPS